MKGDVILWDKEMKRPPQDLSMAHGGGDLTMKCKCFHWRKARRRQYHENLFQCVILSARTGFIFYSSITTKCFLLVLDRSATKLPSLLLSLPFLIQSQATMMTPVAIFKSLPIHMTGLQQGLGIMFL